jgi:hypothetical protein
VVKSDEMPFGDFVARAQPGKDAKKVAAMKEAVRIAALIDAEIRRPESAAAPGGPDKAARINVLLEDLAPHTALLFGSAVPDSGKPVWGGVSSVGFGTSMSAVGLTQKHVEGTPPTQAYNATYAALNERRAMGSTASYYIKGHLLNEKLGGPGAWNNLTPLSRSGNALHETQVESTVKRSIDLPATVEYAVTAAYAARGDKPGLLQAISSGTDTADQKRIKAAIVEAEDHVPKSLAINAWLLEPATSPGQFQRKGAIISRTLDNPVDRKPNSYYLSSSPKPERINLSTSPANKIAVFLGQPLADQLVAARDKRVDTETGATIRWSSYQQIAAAVPGIGTAQLHELEQAGHVSLF